MLQEFKIKPMFEDQYHERHRFTLKFKGDIHQGILKTEKLCGFIPFPTVRMKTRWFRRLNGR